MGFIGLALVAWVVQFFVVWWGIGIATDFRRSRSRAAIWAVIWPYLLVKFVLKFIYDSIYQLVTYKHQKRIETIARLEDQHRNYIKGLMDQDDKAYALGLYGKYPPADWEKVTQKEALR